MRDFPLPGGLLLDELIYDKVQLREMYGAEEDLLSDLTMVDGKPASGAVDRLCLVLSRCTVQLSSTQHDKVVREDGNIRPKTTTDRFLVAWRGCLSADRSAALLGLRIVTLGPKYVFRAQCRNKLCGTVLQRCSSDLEKHEITAFPDKSKEALYGKKEAVLPSGAKMTYRALLSSDDQRMAEQAVPQNQILTTLTVARLDCDRSVLDDMSSRDLSHLRQLFSAEGKIDLNVDLLCPKCGFEVTHTINTMDPAFFIQLADEKS